MWKKIKIKTNAAGLICVFVFGSQGNLAAQELDLSGVPGVVIAHSPKSSGQYLGSASICKLPNGDYVASHDVFGPNSTEHTSAVSRIYKSSSKGRSWKQVASIDGQFWSKLFVHNGMLYLLGTNKHHGNLIIRKSADGGHTWTKPVDRSNGLLLEGEYHTAPMAPVYHHGRLWRAIEDASGPDKSVWGPRYGPMMISIPVDQDLMKADNWTVSNFIPFNSTYLDGKFGGWVEGNAIVSPAGDLVDILRVYEKDSFDEKAALINISADGKRASFDPKSGFFRFPGGSKKFVVRYDEKSRLYWTLSNYVPEEDLAEITKTSGKLKASSIRNTLALCSSSNLLDWKVNKIVLEHEDFMKHGFQYVDWMVQGKDIVFVSRTAYEDGLGGAYNAHNSNLLTFHKLKNFRKFKDKE